MFVFWVDYVFDVSDVSDISDVMDITDISVIWLTGVCVFVAGVVACPLRMRLVRELVPESAVLGIADVCADIACVFSGKIIKKWRIMFIFVDDRWPAGEKKSAGSLPSVPYMKIWTRAKTLQW